MEWLSARFRGALRFLETSRGRPSKLPCGVAAAAPVWARAFRLILAKDIAGSCDRGGPGSREAALLALVDGGVGVVVEARAVGSEGRMGR